MEKRRERVRGRERERERERERGGKEKRIHVYANETQDLHVITQENSHSRGLLLM